MKQVGPNMSGQREAAPPAAGAAHRWRAVALAALLSAGAAVLPAHGQQPPSAGPGTAKPPLPTGTLQLPAKAGAGKPQITQPAGVGLTAAPRVPVVQGPKTATAHKPAEAKPPVKPAAPRQNQSTTPVAKPGAIPGAKAAAGVAAGAVAAGAVAATAAKPDAEEKAEPGKDNRAIDPTKGMVTGLPLPRFASLRSDEVNMRAGPGTRFPIEWVYKRRDLPVQIERELDLWRLIADPDGNKGWVHQATLAGRRSFIVTGGEHALHRSADASSSTVALLKPGVLGRIRQCEANAAWCQVQVGEYRGWLKRGDIWGVAPGEQIQ